MKGERISICQYRTGQAIIINILSGFIMGLQLSVASYPDQTGDTYTERTEYSYSFDKKNKPTGLHIQTKYGNGKSMNYINRTINISIE